VRLALKYKFYNNSTTLTALKTSPHPDFGLKTGGKRHTKALYPKSSEVKVVFKTL